MRSIILAVAVAATLTHAAHGADFEGEVSVRLIHVSLGRLVTMLGAGATQPQKVFEVPVERFAAMKDQPDSGVDVQDLTFLVRGAKVRINNFAPREPNTFVLSDTAKGTLSVIRPTEKSYAELSTAKLEADSRTAAEAFLSQQLDTLSAEKRAQAEQFLKHGKDGAASAVPAPVVKPLGKTLTIAGMQASGYEIKSSEENAIGWVAKDSNNVAPLFKFFQRFEKSLRNNPLQPAAAVVVIADYGIPLRTQVLSASDYLIREVVAIKPKKVEAGLFEVPKGLTAIKQGQTSGSTTTQAPQK